jgi:hypothetical protein
LRTFGSFLRTGAGVGVSGLSLLLELLLEELLELLESSPGMSGDSVGNG